MARWSLLRVCREAGLTEATGRAMVRLGHLNPADLAEADVVAARVAAAVTGALPAPGTARPRNAPVTVPDRDSFAVLLARRAAETGVDLSARLVLTTSQVRLAATDAELAQSLAGFGRQPVLLLPLGEWVAELPSRAARAVVPTAAPPAEGRAA